MARPDTSESVTVSTTELLSLPPPHALSGIASVINAKPCDALLRLISFNLLRRALIDLATMRSPPISPNLITASSMSSRYVITFDILRLNS